MDERQQAIHEKGFGLNYGKIKIGPKTLEDAIVDIESLAKIREQCFSKPAVLRALANKDLKQLRQISEHFYLTSGIYKRVCNYFAFLYRYDWYVTAEVNDESAPIKKVLTDFNNLLAFLDDSHIKKTCGDIALEVIKKGAYYGYLVDSKDRIIIQQLPIEYCRSRYFIGDSPAVEFNMRFFDDAYTDIAQRLKILKLFPDEFAKGYALYKQGKLPADGLGSESGWYLLSTDAAFKINFNNSDVPLFVNSIPSILDLESAQELDRRKQMQKLLKVVIQKLPRDKNNELIFDVDEAADIHNNAVQMLRHAVGVDVLTTFADIDSIDMSDRNTTTTTDDLKKVERALFNALGISQNLFNTDGNMSLEKSILNDESIVRDLLLQFNVLFDRIIQTKIKNKKYRFKLCMLETTQYNYKDLSKMYKEQTQVGFSKVLPQIALGHSQSSIIHTAFFENEILHLSEIMIPPLMSSTLSGEDILGKKNESSSSTSQNKSEGKTGRPEKPDDQKSDKTIQNKESMS